MYYNIKLLVLNSKNIKLTKSFILIIVAAGYRHRVSIGVHAMSIQYQVLCITKEN